MTFVDTNYFLRLFLRADEKQFQIVYRLFQQAIKGKVRLFTSTLVFFEIYWVLSSFYQQEKILCVKQLKNFVSLDYVWLEQREVLAEALDLYAGTALSLEDCYNVIYARTLAGEQFVTFDRKLQAQFKRIQAKFKGGRSHAR